MSSKSSDNPKTILIADDSEMVRTIVREAIERDTEFAVCGEGVDGSEAVSKAKELSPALIILDAIMPGLNGIEVAGILRRAVPRIRIVLLTMFARDIDKSFPSFCHVDVVTSKVNGLADLTAHVTRLLTDRHSDIAAPGESLTVAWCHFVPEARQMIIADRLKALREKKNNVPR